MLRNSDPLLSRLRPVSEWVNHDQAMMFLGNLAERGHVFTLVPDDEATGETDQ